MFENISKLSQKELLALIQLKSRSSKIYGIVLAIVIICLGGIMCFTDLVQGIIFVVIGIGFGIFYFVGYDKLILYKSKNSLTTNDTLIKFDFNEDDLTITASLNGKEFSEEKIVYDQIMKAQETENYIFLFIGSAQAYILDKEGMLEGQDLNMLILFLKAKIRKYIEPKGKKTPIILN